MATPPDEGNGMPVLERVERELTKALQKELQNHPGKWVAMTRSKLIAVGDSMGEVQEKARSAGKPEATVYRVPESDRAYFF
jgi:hypothetical protein